MPINMKNWLMKSGRMQSDISPKALEMWNPSIRAEAYDSETTITIYGVIGEDWWGEGITVKRIDAALRSIGDKPVTVYINSPGGDMWEGIAIHNRLQEHSQKVTIKVIGIAASAASIIAMASNDRQIATSAFLMIHNCWTYLAGNRHFLREVADTMEEFDAAMADVYADTSGQSAEEMSRMMDAESYIRGKKAVELGLCTSIIDQSEVKEVDDEESKQASALKAMDMALAKTGMPRAKRRELFSNLKSTTHNAGGGGTPSAITTDMQNAVAQIDLSASLSAANNILESLRG
ncbi:Clp protease ClpP [Vibrio vulnificus]|uniref:head maturation protease, ClpP-related n=1 Tax=Vibrio vulnificus TaxID=672 RepID=UPI00102A0B74|nr:head maturation protease, ClpP-related [Vibrio vulnificus]RZQ02595.1 Clp protease ClpP [Vibrio vulnificus]